MLMFYESAIWQFTPREPVYCLVVRCLALLTPLRRYSVPSTLLGIDRKIELAIHISYGLLSVKLDRIV